MAKQRDILTRAALVAYLVAKLGRPRAETKSLLSRHAAFFANGIDTSRLTPEAYVDHILDDADAAVAASGVDDPPQAR